MGNQNGRRLRRWSAACLPRRAVWDPLCSLRLVFQAWGSHSYFRRTAHILWERRLCFYSRHFCTRLKKKNQSAVRWCVWTVKVHRNACERAFFLRFSPLLALGFAFYPAIGEKWAALNTKGEAVLTTQGAQNITLSIQGMTCSSCVVHIQKALKKVPGVRTARVSYERKKADVAASKDVLPDALVKAIENEGYHARMIAQ